MLYDNTPPSEVRRQIVPDKRLRYTEGSVAEVGEKQQKYAEITPLTTVSKHTVFCVLVNTQSLVRVKRKSEQYTDEPSNQPT